MRKKIKKLLTLGTFSNLPLLPLAVISCGDNLNSNSGNTTNADLVKQIQESKNKLKALIQNSKSEKSAKNNAKYEAFKKVLGTAIAKSETILNKTDVKKE